MAVFSYENILELLEAADDSLSSLQKFVKAAINKTFFVIAHGQYNPKFETVETVGTSNPDDIPFIDMSEVKGVTGDVSADIVLGKAKLKCSKISKAEYKGPFINSDTWSFIDGEGDTDIPDPAIFTLKKNQFIYGTIPNVYTTVQPNIKGEDSDSFFRARDLESILIDIMCNKVKISYDTEPQSSASDGTERPCLYTPGQSVPNISVSTNFENPGEEGAMGIHYCPPKFMADKMARGRGPGSLGTGELSSVNKGGTYPIEALEDPTDIDTIKRFLQHMKPTHRQRGNYFPIINMVIPLQQLCDILIPDGGLIILPLCFPIRPEIPICGQSLVVPVSFREKSSASQAAAAVATDANISIYEEVTAKIKDLQRIANNVFMSEYYEGQDEQRDAFASGCSDIPVSKWSVVSPELDEDEYGGGWLGNVRQMRSYSDAKEHRKIFGIIEIMMDVYKNFELDAVEDGTKYAELLRTLKELYDKDLELTEKMQYLKVSDGVVKLDKRHIVGVVENFKKRAETSCDFNFPDIEITPKEQFIIHTLRALDIVGITREDVIKKIKEWALSFEAFIRPKTKFVHSPSDPPRVTAKAATKTEPLLALPLRSPPVADHDKKQITIKSYHQERNEYTIELSHETISVSHRDLQSFLEESTIVKVVGDFKYKVRTVREHMKACVGLIRNRMRDIFTTAPPPGGWLHYVTDLYTRTLECGVESGGGRGGGTEMGGYGDYNKYGGVPSHGGYRPSKKKRLIRKLKGLTHKRKNKTKSRRRSRTKSKRRSRTKSKRRSKTKSKRRSRTKSKRRSRRRSRQTS